jgi:hypothetical protein
MNAGIGTVAIAYVKGKSKLKDHSINWLIEMRT